MSPAPEFYGSLTVAVRIANQKVAERARQVGVQIAGVDGTPERELLQQAYGHLRRLIQNTNIDSVSSEKEVT